MKKLLLHIYMVILMLSMTSCYGYRQVGLLQEREDLPQYESADYEPYRLQVNDEIIYRVVTMDETIAKTLSANMQGAGQYANSYRIYSDGTVDIPFLAPVKLAGLTELEAQDTLRKAFREIIPDADVKLAMYNKTFTVLGDAHSGKYAINSRQEFPRHRRNPPGTGRGSSCAGAAAFHRRSGGQGQNPGTHPPGMRPGKPKGRLPEFPG